MTERRCGTCDHRTVFIGWCAKQGRKVPASMGPCPEYAEVDDKGAEK